jgi:hypothetical protein
MSIELLPEFILKNYETHEWKHACAILKEDFPSEWDDLISVLTNFRLNKSWIVKPGGRKSKVSSYIDEFLYKRGWIEKEFATQVVVDDKTMDTPTHKVDCFKNRIALEIEWNNKDLSLIDLTDDDRAVNNFGGGQLESDGSIHVLNNVYQSADFKLIAATDLNIAADIQHKAGGTITLQAGNDILQTGGDIVSGSGSIQLIADQNQSGKGTIVQSDGEFKSATLDITASETVDLSTGTNDLKVIKANITAGDFSYTDSNDISIDNVSASGSVSLISISGFIADASDDSIIDIQSGTGEIFLTASKRISGLENGEDTYLDLAENSQVTALTQNIGSIYLKSFGDLTLSNVATYDGEIKIDTTGSILADHVVSGDMGDNNDFAIVLNSGNAILVKQINADGNLTLNAETSITGTGLVSAKDALITAKTGIGTVDQALNMDVARLDAKNTTDNRIFIENASNLTLIDLDGNKKSIENINGGIIASHHGLNVNSDIEQGADFTLIAGDSDSTQDNLIIAANVTHHGGATITLQAGDDIIHNAGIIRTEGGHIDFIAGSEGSITDSDQGGISNTKGHIIASTVNFQADDSILYTAENNQIDQIKVNVTTGGFAFINEGNIAIDRIVAAGDVILTSQTGSIIDHADDTRIDIRTQGKVLLTANQDIKGFDSGDQYLDLGSSASFSAISINSGNIFVNVEDNLTLETATTENGAIDIIAKGNISVGQIQAEQLILTVTDGSISDMSDDTIVDFNVKQPIQLAATNGIEFLDLAADSIVKSITTDSGDIILNTTGSIVLTEIENKGGSILLTADGKIFATQVEASENINFQSTNDQILVGNIIAGKDITLTADTAQILDLSDDKIQDIQAGGIITLTSAGDFSGLEFGDNAQIKLNLTAAGNIDIYGLGALTIDDAQTSAGSIKIQAEGSITAINLQTPDEISIQNTSGDIEIDHIQSDKTISIIANQGAILEHGNDTDTDINAPELIYLRATSGIKDTTDTFIEIGPNSIIDAYVSGTGDVGLQGTGRLTINKMQTTDGAIDLKSTSHVLMHDIITEGAENDHINIYTSSGNITFNQIISAEDVSLITEYGSIINSRTTKPAIDIDTDDHITLIASKNIGSYPYLTVAAGSEIVAKSTDEGSISIKTTGDITLQSLETTDGNITVTADGNIQALNIKTDDRGDNESITLSIVSKGIVETGIIQADNFLYISGDRIVKSFGQISGKDVSISAINGVGTVGRALLLDVNRLDISNRSTGDIYIQGLGDLTLADITGQGKSIDNRNGGLISTSGTLNIDADISQETDFTLSADENINIAANIIQRGDGNIQIEAGKVINQTSGIIQANTTVNLIAGGIDQVSGSVLTDQLIIQSQNTVSLLSESNDINMLSAQIKTGNLIFTNKNDLTFDTVQAQNAVTLTSVDGALIADDDSSTADILAKTVLLTARETISGLNGAYFDISDGSTVTAISTNRKDIYIHGLGDLILEKITTGGVVQIEAEGDIQAKNINSFNVNIKSKQGNIGAGEITADNDIQLLAGNSIYNNAGTLKSKTLLLEARHGIGTTSVALQTDVNKLDAINQYIGDMYIQNAGDLTIADLNADNKAIDNIGGGSILSEKSLTISGDIYQNDDFLLIAQTGQLTIDANIFHTASGDIRMTTGADIVQTSGVIVTNEGRIHFNANGNIKQENGEIKAGTTNFTSLGDVNFINGSNDVGVLSAKAQNINYKDTNTIEIDNITVNATITVLAQNQITAQNLIAANVNLTSKTGSINAASIFAENALILNAGDTINKTEGTITAEDAILKAANGIGTQDNSFTIEVNRLDIVNTTSGNIYISNTGELNLIDLNNDGKAIDNAGGGSIETHSPLNVLSDISQAKDFTLTAGSRNDSGDNLTIKANITHTLGGTITLMAGDNIVYQAGVIESVEGSILLSVEEGNIIQTGGSIHAEKISFNAKESVEIQSTTNKIGTIQAIVKEGAFTYTGNDNMTIDQIIAGGSVIISTDTISDYSYDNAFDIQSGRTINLTATTIGNIDNALNLANNSTVIASTRGNINLTSSGNLTLKDITTSKGTINITTEGDIIAQNITSTDTDDTANNEISLNSKQGDILIGNIITDDHINIIASKGNINVQNITTDKSIKLTSIEGNIQQSQEDANIQGNELILTAKTGIDLTTDISHVEAQVIGSGDIVLKESDNIILNTLTTFDGSIVVNAGGSLEAINVNSVDGSVTINAQGEFIAKNISATKRIISSQPQNITLSTIGGNMIIDFIVADNDILINVKDGNLLDNNDPEIDIQANSLFASADEIEKVNFDVSNIKIKSLNSGVIPYLDYLKPKAYDLNFPADLFKPEIDLTPFDLYIEEQTLLDPEEILDIAHIEFSSMALLEPEKVSDYEVKWISDSLDKNDKDVEALKRKEFQSKAKKEKEAKDNQSAYNYNYETKNPVAKEAETTQPAIVYNKDFQKTDTKVSSPVHMRVESRLLIEDVEATVIEPEKAAIKHLTTKELQPKKKFVDKIMGFFAKLG